MKYEPLPATDGGANFDLVEIDKHGKPHCAEHGAMNKVSPSPRAFWRCLGGLARCPAGCMEMENESSVPERLARLPLVDALRLLPALCREHRHATDSSYQDAAHKMGVSKSVLFGFEHGENSRLTTAIAVAEWLSRKT